MTSKELKLIEARIKDELTNISYLLSELEKRGLLENSDSSGKSSVITDDSFMLRAIGSVLHDFYVMVENIFEIIGREIDEYLPEGMDWHIQLLRQMALEIASVRPAVISKSTLLLLDKYQSFRHVFRNVYGFSLDGAKLVGLVGDLSNTSKQFSQELEVFVDEIKRVLE